MPLNGMNGDPQTDRKESLKYPKQLGLAPLFPVAVAGTLGIVCDRLDPLPIPTGWLVALGMLLGWGIARRSNPLLAQVFLWLCWFGLGVGYHHSWRWDYPPSDLSHYATPEPKLVQIRGLLRDEFVSRLPQANHPLRSQSLEVRSVSLLQAEEILNQGYWLTCSGYSRLIVEGLPEGIHSGDRIEVLGWLNSPPTPQNPAEKDMTAILRDDRIGCELRVRKSSTGVVRLEAGEFNVNRLLAQIKGYAHRVIQNELADQSGLASALLLGENQSLANDEWQKYVRTGVIHVLAISGQHLVILGAFLWGVFRLIGCPYRLTALGVAGLLLIYALLTGGRPSAMRAAVMVACFCVGTCLGRKVFPLNTFCLAWMIVLILKPTDLFTAGFQLSFLCVAALVWLIPRLIPPYTPEEIEKLIDQARPPWERWGRSLIKIIIQTYVISLILSLVTLPLIAYWQNLVSPIGIVIGPVMILLTTLALLSGFCLLLLSPLGWFNPFFGVLTTSFLNGCERIVTWADGTPGGCWWTGPVSLGWLVGFYALGLGAIALLQPINQSLCVGRFQDRLFLGKLLMVWVILGLAWGLYRPLDEELRITILAVGHGNCAVLETPEGRTILIDAGSDSGPETTSRVIAPFLWSRGIRRLDEVFLSHADLDHFNTLPELSARFRIGRVNYNPTFPDKPTAGVALVLETLASRGIETQAASAGQTFLAGAVRLSILHPPVEKIEGEENARSLVIQVEHRGHKILFTGDLEKQGLTYFMNRYPSPQPDVVVVPHHGSASVNTESFVQWLQPKFAIASQAKRDSLNAEAHYQRQQIPYWDTARFGAITLRSHPSGLTTESFLQSQRQVIRAGSVGDGR